MGVGETPSDLDEGSIIQLSDYLFLYFCRLAEQSGLDVARITSVDLHGITRLDVADLGNVKTQLEHLRDFFEGNVQSLSVLGLNPPDSHLVDAQYAGVNGVRRLLDEMVGLLSQARSTRTPVVFVGD